MGAVKGFRGTGGSSAPQAHGFSRQCLIWGRAKPSPAGERRILAQLLAHLRSSETSCTFKNCITHTLLSLRSGSESISGYTTSCITTKFHDGLSHPHPFSARPFSLFSSSPSPHLSHISDIESKNGYCCHSRCPCTETSGRVSRRVSRSYHIYSFITAQVVETSVR